MKIVFIAGPFNGDRTQPARERNVEIAKQYAIALTNQNIGFYCPHIHTMQLMLSQNAPESDDFFRDLNREYLVKMCSAVLALPGWEESSGARKEVEFAKEKGWPVFKPSSPDDIESIVAWAKGS